MVAPTLLWASGGRKDLSPPQGLGESSFPEQKVWYLKSVSMTVLWEGLISLSKVHANILSSHRTPPVKRALAWESEDQLMLCHRWALCPKDLYPSLCLTLLTCKMGLYLLAFCFNCIFPPWESNGRLHVGKQSCCKFIRFFPWKKVLPYNYVNKYK